jgi:hypothetical protein
MATRSVLERFGPIERMPPPDLSPMPLELETLE